jgi:hypothetical protein
MPIRLQRSLIGWLPNMVLQRQKSERRCAGRTRLKILTQTLERRVPQLAFAGDATVFDLDEYIEFKPAHLRLFDLFRERLFRRR